MIWEWYMVLYEVHTIPMSSTTVTRQLLFGVYRIFMGGTHGIGMGLSHINAILFSMGNVWDLPNT